MSVNWVLLLLCSVCMPVVFGGIIEELKKEINATKKETNLVNEENKNIEGAIEAEKEAWEKWFNKATSILTNLTTEHTALITEMKLLNNMIIGNGTIKYLLILAIEDANFTAGKYGLAITIMNDVLGLLENGRDINFHNQCEKYEPLIRGILINEAIINDKNNTIKILKEELRKAKLELQKVKFRKQELVKTLAQIIENYKVKKDHYRKLISDAFKNLKSAETTVNDFKNELAALLKEVQELKITLKAITTSIVLKKADAEKLQSRYEDYDKDIACYKRLQKDVFKRS